MDLELAGKRALVTGGSKGIGRAIARQLALEGARVAIAARDRATLREAAAALTAETGQPVIGLPVDTGDDDAVKAMVEAAMAELGGIDILVNSAARPAGQAPPPQLADSTTALFFEEMNTKVMGYLRCAREVAPHMMRQGWGRIVNISGLAARNAVAPIWSMRNVAVAAMTKNLADELGPHGINVTVVHPGLTRTERTPAVIAARAKASGATAEAVEAGMAAGILIGRIVEAAEIGYVVAFLASPKSVSITGDAIACAGGVKGPIYY